MDNFFLLKGKVNNNTNIHLDLRQIGFIVFGLRPHTITTNIVVGLDEYLLFMKHVPFHAAWEQLVESDLRLYGIFVHTMRLG